jgi:roadblock/LC7 domain-containing protein
MSGMTRDRAIELENRLIAAGRLMVTAVGDMTAKAESLEQSASMLAADTSKALASQSATMNRHVSALEASIDVQSQRFDQFKSMRFFDRVRWIVTGR